MTPSDYYTSSAWEAAHQGYNTKAGAEAANSCSRTPITGTCGRCMTVAGTSR